jgi:L-aspartate oxidase
MKKIGSDKVFLDVTHLPPHVITTRFPHIFQFCFDHGLDITRSLIPVAPAAHYMIGGVSTNTWGETNIAGLFATGEVACTGVHGANRLASNSLLEAIVFSRRIIERTSGKNGGKRASRSRKDDLYPSFGERQAPAAIPSASLTALQQLHWNQVGIIREKQGLNEAAGILAAWQNSLPQATDQSSYEISNLILIGRLLTEAALLREESRGAHFRSDYPRVSAKWHRHIIWKK